MQQVTVFNKSKAGSYSQFLICITLKFSSPVVQNEFFIAFLSIFMSFLVAEFIAVSSSYKEESQGAGCRSACGAVIYCWYLGALLCVGLLWEADEMGVEPEP